jgi:effector-binding domain-containing protein
MMAMSTILTYGISTQVLTDRCTAVVRAELPADELPAWLADAFPTVHGYVTRERIDPAGPPFARLAFLGKMVAVEAGFPVPHEVPGDGTVEPSTLPDGLAAVTTHWGRYEDVEKAYLACRIWLDNHGFEPAGPHWEIYRTDSKAEPDPARWRTDVVVPYHAGTACGTHVGATVREPAR